MMRSPAIGETRFSSAHLGSARGPLCPVFPNPTIMSLAKPRRHAEAPFYAFQIPFKDAQTGGKRTTTEPKPASDKPAAPKSP